MNDQETKDFIILMFEGYSKRKQENRLYDVDSPIPKRIIQAYYENNSNPKFEYLMTNFRRKYIYNENAIEDVHDVQERNGLRIAYEYSLRDRDPNQITIYEILKLHQLLFSKTPYPEFGGQFRNQPIFLPNSGVETADWSFIPSKIASLHPTVKEIVEEGSQIKSNNDVNKIIDYIDKCVTLNCELIKIHPFYDGNGRTIRSFTNMLFKVANIPPVYVKISERKEYGRAMNLAIADNDYSHIKQFYYYKICDSIYDLGIIPELQQQEQNNSHIQKVKK